MKRRSAIVAAILTALALIMAIILRGSTETLQNMMPNFSAVQTAAVATFVSRLTQTASAQPTFTSTSTLVPTSTPTFINVNVTEATITPTPSCYRLRWIKDVTIPDFSKMHAGETFTKTWQVSNSGTCAWQPGFQFAFYGGDPMGGSNYILTQAVSPGEQMNLSIPMTAPSGAGIIISTWRMSVNGWFFGDALTVKIDLGGETPTP